MPYILILLGTILFVAGTRNTQGTLWTLVKGDVTGQDSFLVWIAAIAVVGGLGYVPKLRPFSIALMTLLLIVLVIKKDSGVFAQLSQFAINPTAAPQTIIPTTVTNTGTGSAGATSFGLQPIAPIAPITPLAGVISP